MKFGFYLFIYFHNQYKIFRAHQINGMCVYHNTIEYQLGKEKFKKIKSLLSNFDFIMMIII